jgi:hypothetical protein
MMSETINAVVNNIWDRLNEIVELVKPAVETVNTVSVAVVQETALAGFAYVAIGGISLVLCATFVLGSIRASRLCGKADEEKDEEGQSRYLCVLIFMIVLSIISCFAGVACVLANLGSWLAPTREVLREVITHI